MELPEKDLEKPPPPFRSSVALPGGGGGGGELGMHNFWKCTF